MIADELTTLVGIGPLPSVKPSTPRVAVVAATEATAATMLSQEKCAPKSFDEIEVEGIRVGFTQTRDPHAHEANTYAAEEMENDIEEIAATFDDEIDAEYGTGLNDEIDPADFGLKFDVSEMASESAMARHDNLVMTLASELEDEIDQIPLSVRNFIENDLRARFIAVSAVAK